MRNGAHEIAEYFETIIDVVSCPKLPADRRLLVALTAEEHVTTRDTSRTEKVMPLKPLQQCGFRRFVTPRNEPNVLSEPLLNEPCDRFHSPFNRRRFGVAMVSHGLRLVILADTVDDDAPDVDAEHFRLVHAHPSNGPALSGRPERSWPGRSASCRPAQIA